VNDSKPWIIVKEDLQKFTAIMTNLVVTIHEITRFLWPIMPQTAKNIANVFGLPQEAEIPKGYKFIIKKDKPLFPRL